MLKQAPKFLRLFKKWQESFDMCYIKIDQNLFRDVNTLAIFMYTSCILEHSFAHLKFFPIVENSELRLLNVKDLKYPLQNASAWETYYWRSHPFVGDLIPYHFVSAFTIFICSKYCILAWNFGDILVAVMSRALSYRFKMLYEQASEELLSDNGLVTKNSKKWSRFIAKHDMLRELTQEFDDLLSPLIFTLLGVNLFSFCLQLNLGLTPKATTSLIASVYAVWSFLHLIMRILVATIAASNVNLYAHKIEAILKKCPMECYSPQIERTERAIRSSKVGLSGLGCFIITRPFILQIVNVVFTFEIVLLQTGNTNSTS
ncbi:unnamed protein product [Allacma fusca]|uniref:Gustatory receptor n=1 Tax=Allacma fusca TaxID=39272 RepID=A0A8J2NTS1_9HEXA|nr:unnamed protein product [Allacma fusca]